MFVRKSLTGAITAALAGSALVLSAGAAHAVYTADPDDTTFTPTSADLIGVGSDTSQNALLRIATAYNATSPAPAHKVATFAATGGGTIVLPTTSPDINRPNGSGAGKTLLYNPSNPDIDFARASSSLNDTEIGANLKQFPFALDTLKMAVSGQVTSHAPASLTIAQIVSIYKGDVTDWSQVGGAPGTIVPLIPQGGSGTRSFFEAQLKAANGNVAVPLGGAVTSVQEHDPAPIQGNADAVAPFSAGRAGLAGGALRLENGFSADRALYNVVRSADLGDADIQAVFGPGGFVCSEAARASIEAAGFKQLATAENNGVCGEVTTAATTDFTISTGPATTDDTDFLASTSDIIGVGSDTSQNAVYRLANAYNASNPTHKLATFAALGGGQIPLPTAAINRPNGSGAGKTLLYNPSNTDIDFARSSSSLNDTEIGAGLKQFPFALDTLKMAVSNTVASHAPTSLTIAQIVSIYKGDITDWSQLGGTAGTIVPLIPQGGSGTRSFFEAQLKAANGNVAVPLGGAVTSVQEHDPAPIQSNPNAVGPFSAGRAGLAGTALRLEDGFSADRALYNVVRSADLGDADIQAIFGEEGFICSDAARPSIVAAGFKQLDSTGDGGVCGSVTTVATTNFATNDPVVLVDTTTGVTASNPSTFVLKLVAAVSGAGTPTGTVAFTSGSTSLGTATLAGGSATLTLSGVKPGSYPVTATYTPAAATAFQPSTGSVNGAVAKARSAITAKAKKQGKKLLALVTVKYVGYNPKVSGGKVTIKKGAKVVGTGTVKNGKVTITLKNKSLKKGTNSLKATWAGNSLARGASSKAFTVKK